MDLLTIYGFIYILLSVSYTFVVRIVLSLEIEKATYNSNHKESYYTLEIIFMQQIHQIHILGHENAAI